ncbi:MAG TPA: protoporphyrinogen oxidase [Gemmatimonadales bacterium]|nr:protoporphyrinogen oxidase [Gemmatimonadales bacterium]
MAVLGGGPGALAAALRLRQLGVEPVLESPAAPAESMISTRAEAGWLVEEGAGWCGPATAQVAALLASCGCDQGKVTSTPASRRRYLVHHGRLVAVPESTAEILASPLLSIGGRMRMLREPFVPRGGDDPEESVASFTRRRFGEEVAARFFDPLISGSSGADPEHLVACYTFPDMVAHERRSGSVLKGRVRAARKARREGRQQSGGEPWSFPEGLAGLQDRMLKALGPVSPAAGRVVEVEVLPDRAGVMVRHELGDSPRFDAAVMVLPARVLGGISVVGNGGVNLAPLATIPHASLVTVSLGYRRSQVAHPLDGHGVLVPSSERRRILAIRFSSSQFPGRAPDDHVLLTVTLGGARQPGQLALDDAALTAIATEEVAELLGASGRPVITRLARWPAAVALAVSGHGHRLAAAEQLEAGAQVLALSGAWRDGNGVMEGMQGALDAVDRLAVRLGWAETPREET